MSAYIPGRSPESTTTYLNNLHGYAGMGDYTFESLTGREKQQKVRAAMDMDEYSTFRDFFREKTPYMPGSNHVMKQTYDDGTERYIIELGLLTEDDAQGGIYICLEDSESSLEDTITAGIDHYDDEGLIDHVEKFTYDDGAIVKDLI